MESLLFYGTAVIEDITLDPSKKTNHIPEMFGHLSWDAPFSLNLLRMTEIQGKLNYTLNKSRKNKAINISINN